MRLEGAEARRPADFLSSAALLTIPVSVFETFVLPAAQTQVKHWQNQSAVSPRSAFVAIHHRALIIIKLD